MYLQYNAVMEFCQINQQDKTGNLLTPMCLQVLWSTQVSFFSVHSVIFTFGQFQWICNSSLTIQQCFKKYFWIFCFKYLWFFLHIHILGESTVPCEIPREIIKALTWQVFTMIIIHIIHMAYIFIVGLY